MKLSKSTLQGLKAKGAEPVNIPRADPLAEKVREIAAAVAKIPAQIQASLGAYEASMSLYHRATQEAIATAAKMSRKTQLKFIVERDREGLIKSVVAKPEG